MKKKISCDIKIDHLGRVEGHGNIRIRIENGRVEEARWEVVESPRFFEAMLVGKHYENAPWLCARICGICSISHSLASIRAVEHALQITPSEQTRQLRLLLKHMETLQSHILHLYFLAAPDYLHRESVMPLIESHPEEVQRGLRLKMLANDACDLIGGRAVHPTRTVVGGFTMLPEKVELRELRGRLERATADLAQVAALFRSFAIPDFARQTEFISLRGESDYPFIGGDLLSSEGTVRPETAYPAMTNEYQVDHSTSKWSRAALPSMAVGALARFNNNFTLLHPAARQLAGELGLHPKNHNPFMNNIAQVVECLQVVLDGMELIDSLLDRPWQPPRQPVQPMAGYGVGAVEAPRGILYHAYELDRDGRIVRADCIPPTSQNHANIHADIRELAGSLAARGTGDAEIRRLAEMLVRAYDPCISCSVH